ncbi:MAG: hypothetical protein R3D67_14540 [Hyphomicrobiaceae bacterium]
MLRAHGLDDCCAFRTHGHRPAVAGAARRAEAGRQGLAQSSAGTAGDLAEAAGHQAIASYYDDGMDGTRFVVKAVDGLCLGRSMGFSALRVGTVMVRSHGSAATIAVVP